MYKVANQCKKENGKLIKLKKKKYLKRRTKKIGED